MLCSHFEILRVISVWGNKQVCQIPGGTTQRRVDRQKPLIDPHDYRVVLSGFDVAGADCCRLRTLRVCCRQLKHRSTLLRKPSSNPAVTQGFVFSHQPQVADSFQAVSVTFMKDLSRGVGKSEGHSVLSVTHESLPACGKGPCGRKRNSQQPVSGSSRVDRVRSGSPDFFTVVKGESVRGRLPVNYAAYPTDRSSRSSRCS